MHPREKSTYAEQRQSPFPKKVGNETPEKKKKTPRGNSEGRSATGKPNTRFNLPAERETVESPPGRLKGHKRGDLPKNLRFSGEN